jgi:transcriptional regulator with XRE-family HTH domain
VAPPRRRITQLGECLRAAREALRLDQAGLAQRVFVSVRQVSRWENGQRPNAKESQRIFDLLSLAPGIDVPTLADVLGIELPEDEEPIAPVAPQVEAQPAPPPPVPAPVAPQLPPSPPAETRPPSTALRASLDAIILAAAEHRDLLPRHLRAFAVEMFQGADRLGLSAREAAALVAPTEGKDGRE